MSRSRIAVLSRSIIVLLVGTSLGMLLWKPHGGWWLLDIGLRTYLAFLGTVMAHEATHGALGRGKQTNLWWGRLALVPVMVPFTNFRRTHLLHHAFTNDPARDPDYFVKHGRPWEIPLRALGMPHQWFFWLWKRNKLRRNDLIELAWNYVAIFAVYGLVVWVGDVQRIVLGMLPSLCLVSILLWHPFAYRTHEGYSLGDEVGRSHNYYGRGMFWLSLGLSMHRVHHMQPKLAWLEMLPYVETAPGPWWRRLLPLRDLDAVRVSVEA